MAFSLLTIENKIDPSTMAYTMQEVERETARKILALMRSSFETLADFKNDYTVHIIAELYHVNVDTFCV